MKLKNSKRLFWGLVVFINVICISLAVWSQMQYDQEIVREQLEIKYMQLYFSGAVEEAQELLKLLESDKPILVWTDSSIMALGVMLISVIYIFMFLLIRFHRKKVYQKNMEFHQLIQKYVNEKYDASQCPEIDLWMHRKSNRQNICFLIVMLWLLLCISFSMIVDFMWFWPYVVLLIGTSIVVFVLETVNSVKTGKYIVQYYEKYKRPVEVIKAWYCVRCEDKIVAYKIKLDDLNLALWLHTDDEYEGSETIAEFVWSRVKPRYKKGIVAMQYYYIKYINARKLGLDTEQYLQELCKFIEENPKVEYGKKIKAKIEELEEN